MNEDKEYKITKIFLEEECCAFIGKGDEREQQVATLVELYLGYVGWIKSVGHKAVEMPAFNRFLVRAGIVQHGIGWKLGLKPVRPRPQLKVHLWSLDYLIMPEAKEPFWESQCGRLVEGRAAREEHNTDRFKVTCKACLAAMKRQSLVDFADRDDIVE
ncbi:MAG: hypothetical protein HN929_06105 [Chloroflexi bacterium]|nr:hypothetical protein [Chloroflexota bacterium]